jgi:maltose alpha-D-glucosyltransferase/alpha-amylase
MSIDDLWYKNAILYCLDVEKYQDANGDGVGDFEGLMRRLDYLQGLGVTCVWLQPFYPSPNRDNGYDVTDYYGVNAKHGSLGDFVAFMQHAHGLGIRVIVDLVVNHTSVDSPWFQQARADRKSFFRDWYVWSDIRPGNHKEGIVFPGQQTTTWTKDKRAKQYYFHRFYEHQADLNTWHPYVRAEIQKIMGFWLQLGVSGFRMDAVPFLIEKKGAGIEHQMDFNLLKEMRDFLQWRSGEAIMLAEANVPPDESLQYFGDEGDRLQMMLNFPVNQRLFYALATGDLDPLINALEDTRRRPRDAQWVQFLRSHDELDLGRLTPEQRQKVFDAFGPEKRMQLYDRGIRRRLAPMLGNDRRKLELAFSLLFSLPGTPMMQYGDEIGIGDDLRLPERECARTPMQWTSGRHGGFSRARKVVRPVINDKMYGYKKVNCRCPATRCSVAPELDGADNSRAQGMSRDQLGQLRGATDECSRSVGDALRLAQYLARDVSQLQQRETEGQSQDRLRERRSAGGGIRRSAQQGAQRRCAPHRTGWIRLALVPRRRRRQCPGTVRFGSDEPDALKRSALAPAQDGSGPPPADDTLAPNAHP